jgi:hypothetical protein
VHTPLHLVHVVDCGAMAVDLDDAQLDRVRERLTREADACVATARQSPSSSSRAPRMSASSSSPSSSVLAPSSSAPSGFARRVDG